MGQGLKNMGQSLNSFLDYFDVTGDKFFLKVAFVPSDGYFEEYTTGIKVAANDKFPVFEQLATTFKSVSNQVGVDKKTWEGIKVNVNKFGVGTITVIDPTYINAATPKLKFWIGGLMYFFIIMYCIRKISVLIGAGR